ncbi:hypothetical protein B5V01_24840 [Mesorhizobium erdmanii]|uniref:Terminase large subunit gp17-like C-terminal domain-containing protein n=3 Tax=Phyllobacteriaceae TaxID=69277 RepID=A0A3M9XH34_9HYPH|nr:hypothetical protein DNR46_05970 [Mesorhizobium japonicum]RXT40428.1 hypothetical protein B5V01_24840 [Mesorhizobium erdmanii]
MTRHVTFMTIDDAAHYSPEERAAIVAAYPAHEREARARGIPVLGSGRIFPVAEALIACEPFRLPRYWPRIGALDFGWDHPSAAIELAWDTEADVVYVTKAARASQQTPAMQTLTLKPWGEWLPFAWPRDGRRETLEGAGVALAKQYAAHGLNMLSRHAQFPDGSVSVEAGLMEMLDRMQSGRFKVFSTLADWWEEFRLFHRKNGQVVKLRDDLMAATRYTHQPSQEVRGMHRHRLGGTFGAAGPDDSNWAVVESAAVTPGQDGNDDLWLVVKRTIGGVTRRYIEIKTAPFEYGAIAEAFEVDCGLTYTGAAVATVGGAAHLAGQSVDVLADGKVYRGLTVSGGGTVMLPGGATAAKWQVGLPYAAGADTLELDVGGKDGSIIGRRKKVAKAILSLLETDTTGLEVQSFMRGRWEPVRMPSIVAPDGRATLFTGNVEVPIDDSWEGQGRVRIRHVNPTPCTIRAFTPVFDAEP